MGTPAERAPLPHTMGDYTPPLAPPRSCWVVPGGVTTSAATYSPSSIRPLLPQQPGDQARASSPTATGYSWRLVSLSIRVAANA